MGDVFHCDVFVKGARENATRLRDAFGQVWTHDIKELTDAVTSFCPVWQHTKDTLLENASMKAEFLKISDPQVHGIVTFVAELKRQLVTAEAHATPVPGTAKGDL